jgi:hypothetical protein
VHRGALSDEERRNRAADLASRFAQMLMDEEDDDDE